MGGDSSNTRSKGELLSVNRFKCKIHKKTDHILYHDCDTGPGSSGAMLFGMWNNEAHIVGINFAQLGSNQCPRFDDELCANLAISESIFSQRLISFLKIIGHDQPELKGKTID